jgi:RHS repeat-associated protein
VGTGRIHDSNVYAIVTGVEAARVLQVVEPAVVDIAPGHDASPLQVPSVLPLLWMELGDIPCAEHALRPGHRIVFYTDGITETRTHDVVNELTTIDATALIYDANGNLRADGGFNYVYDEENRLVRVTRNSDSAIVGQYLYDALGRRITRVASPSATFDTTLYFHDATRVIEEQNDVGATQATYVYGTYVDEVLTMDRGGQTFYYHQNALWSVGAITDSAGGVSERYAYDAYGAPTVTTGSFVAVPPNAWGTAHSAIGNPWMFTGRQLDEESGLYFYRARYYDAGKGRFVQRDPKGYVDGMNLYEYVRSNPVNRADPEGQASFHPDIKVVAAGKKTGDCGGATYSVKWEIPNANKNDAGWIVQRVGVTFDVKDCDDKKIDVKAHTGGEIDPAWWPLWEGWEFTAGQNVWVGSAANKAPHRSDTYAMPDFGDCTKGKIEIDGEVKAITGFRLPADMKPTNKAPAWSLPMTQKEPAGWASDLLPPGIQGPPAPLAAGAVHRMTIEWNCCPKGVVTKATTVTTQPEK